MALETVQLDMRQSRQAVAAACGFSPAVGCTRRLASVSTGFGKSKMRQPWSWYNFFLFGVPKHPWFLLINVYNNFICIDLNNDAGFYKLVYFEGTHFVFFFFGGGSANLGTLYNLYIFPIWNLFTFVNLVKLCLFVYSISVTGFPMIF